MNEAATPSANVRAGDGGGMLMSPIGVMASATEAAAQAKGRERGEMQEEEQVEGAAAVEKETEKGQAKAPAEEQGKQEQQEVIAPEQQQQPQTTPAPSARVSSRASRGKPLAKKRGALKAAATAARNVTASTAATAPATPAATHAPASSPAATPTSRATLMPRGRKTATGGGDNEGKGNGGGMTRSPQKTSEKEEAMKEDMEVVVMDDTANEEVDQGGGENQQQGSHVMIIADSNDEGEAKSPDGVSAAPPAAAPADSTTITATPTVISKAAAKKAPVKRGASPKGKGKAAAASKAGAEGSAVAESKKPVSPLEASYQDKLEKLLVAFAHRGAAEADYRLDVEEVLEAARACKVVADKAGGVTATAAAATTAPSAAAHAAAIAAGEEGNKEEATNAEALTETVTIRTGVDVTTSVSSAAAVEAETSSVTVPEGLIPLLARLVQGSPLPLSQLTRDIIEYLTTELVPCVEELPVDVLKKKIRLLAERKAYGVKPRAAIVAEDLDSEAVWRWEVVQGEFLSNRTEGKNAVKEARSERSNVGKHVKALSHLIKTIRKDPTASAAISQAEEKVLGLERQAEVVKQRKALVQKKETEKLRAVAEKAEKLRQREEEKYRKKEEREQKEKERQEEKRRKEEAAAAAAAAGDDGIDGFGGGKKKIAVVLDVKQPAISAFFSKAKTPILESAQTAAGGLLMGVGGSSLPLNGLSATTAAAALAGLGGDAGGEVTATEVAIALEAANAAKVAAMDAVFKAGPMDREELLKDLRERGKASLSAPRNPKHKPHRFQTVHVTVTHKAAEGGMWAQPEFAVLEEKRLWNAMKFLSFAEDVRPPYYGTWSRRSRDVKPRRFWGKSKFLDYGYDSEEDWEEGEEDGDGENLSVTAENDREEDKDFQDGLDYTDGWLARDDELDREDEEDGQEGGEEGVGRQAGPAEERGFVRLGLHFFDVDFEAERPIVDERIRPALAGYRVVCTQAGGFPIKLPYFGAPVDESVVTVKDGGAVTPTGSPKTSPSRKGKKKAGAADGEGSCGGAAAGLEGGDVKAADVKPGRGPKTVDAALVPELLKLVEGSTLGKDKLIDAFLATHPGAASKLQIKALIESSAEKQKCTVGSACGKMLWVVKQELLDQFALQRYQPPPAPVPAVSADAVGIASAVPSVSAGTAVCTTPATKKRKAAPKKTKVTTATLPGSAATIPVAPATAAATAAAVSVPVSLSATALTTVKTSAAVAATMTTESGATVVEASEEVEIVAKEPPVKKARKSVPAKAIKDVTKGTPTLTKFWGKDGGHTADENSSQKSNHVVAFSRASIPSFPSSPQKDAKVSAEEESEKEIIGVTGGNAGAAPAMDTSS